MPIRICHLITDLETGGAERSLVNLVTGMDSKRFRNEVICLVELGHMAEPLVAAGISVKTLGMRRGRPTFSGLLELMGSLRRARPVILQTWLYHADLVGTVASWVARPDRMLWNVRCTDITHVASERPSRRLVKALALLSGQPEVIVVNSEAGRRDHQAIGYHPRAWADIPNGVDLARFRVRRDERVALRARLGLDPDAIVVGLVARNHQMKDVDTFLHAASLLAQHHTGAQFVLCGAGFSADNVGLTARIAALNLQRNLVLLGKRGDLEDIYPTLDMLTLCSTYGEGFPNVLCEAMSCGVPCLVTSVGDSAMIVGDTGMVVPLRNPRAVADGWQAMIARGLPSLGEHARARVEKNYSLDLMIARYTSLYESLAAKSKEPREEGSGSRRYD